ARRSAVRTRRERHRGRRRPREQARPRPRWRTRNSKGRDSTARAQKDLLGLEEWRTRHHGAPVTLREPGRSAAQDGEASLREVRRALGDAEVERDRRLAVV